MFTKNIKNTQFNFSGVGVIGEVTANVEVCNDCPTNDNQKFNNHVENCEFCSTNVNNVISEVQAVHSKF